MTDLSTLLAELDAAYAEVREYGPETVNVCCKGIVALVNAYPQLREALRSLRAELNTTRPYRELWEACEETAGELAALVEQQREALRDIIDLERECREDIANDCDSPLGIEHSGDVLGFVKRLADKCRAVLAAEVP